MKIDNGMVALEFDDVTGSVRQITDRRTGKRYLQDPRGHRLAKLVVPTPEHVSRPLYSHDAGRPGMTRRGDTLEIAFPELRDRGTPAGVFLTVRVRLPEGSPEARFSAVIRNESPYRVHEMWFPWLGGRQGRPGACRDVITTSKNIERDIYARLFQAGASTHTFGHHHLRLAYDPLHLLPMMDLSDADGGLSYIKYEARPSPHILVFENPLPERANACLTWAWVTGVFIEPGQTWTSCEFGVGVHQGDWHATADRFRQWLAGWWKPCDTPRAVREKIGLLHIHTHGFSGERHHEFAELPALARDARRYGVRDLLIWDCTASVYYRPDRGDFWEMPPSRKRELKRALAAVRHLGVSVSSFVNCRLAAEYNRTWSALKPLVQESLFGVGLFGFPCCTMDGGWYNDPGYEMGSHAVCCGADGYRPYANAVLDRTFELGFDAIAVDQASEWNYCLSRTHGHASPWEAWARTYDWYAEVTRATRARSAAAYTVAELPDLYNTQHIDLWWNWMWRDNAWACLPVFRYVLPSMIPVWCIDENQRDVIAEAFGLGSFLAIATRDMTGRLSDAPELAAQVKRLALDYTLKSRRNDAMKRNHVTRTLLPIFALAAFALTAAQARGEKITIALVAEIEGKPVSMEESQLLWSSPFGGWVLTTWPFSMRVGERPIMDYRSGEQKLMDATAAERMEGEADWIDNMVGDLADTSDVLVPEDLRDFRFDRKASATLDLPGGQHVIHPFDVAFTIGADGVPATLDTRARINARARRIELVCHPVTVKLFSATGSAVGPLKITYNSSDLLRGVAGLLSEYTSKIKTSAGSDFRRMILYLPPSAPGKSYEVNGVRFELDTQGRVKLAEGANASCVDGREIRLRKPAPPALATRLIGVRWHGAASGVNISAGNSSIVEGSSTGSAFLTIPPAGEQSVRLGSQVVRLPATDARYPHGMLVWKAAAGECWLVETPALALTPGAEYRCRLTPLTAAAPALPPAVRVQLEAEPGGAPGGELDLMARGDGIYAGALPPTPGLWRLRAATEGPLQGQVLGLVFIAANEPAASVSLFTFRNRGLVRRGDPVQVLWSMKHRTGLPAAEWQVVLRGMGVRAPVGKIAVPASDKGGASSGHLTLDTSALAPGAYEIGVVADGVIGYPLSFRICQREPLSDFEMYSYVFGPAQPYGNSPVNAYYGGSIPNDPALAPFMGDVDAPLDAALATYATAAAGPVMEKFERPPSQEAALMSLASLGMRAVPAIPPMLHHEDWNPKHSLPEDLARLRRRLALFVQSFADVPGFSGIELNWYGTLRGYWEESPPLDGHQGRRNAEAGKWIAERVEEVVAEAAAAGIEGEQLKVLRGRAGTRFTSSVLPNAYKEYLVDAVQIKPDFTSHTALPSFWMGGGQSYPPYAFANVTHRGSVDYTDYGIAPWGNFRAPASMGMGNFENQKMYCCYMTYGRHSRIVTAFGAAGRGLDGISLTLDDPYPKGQDEALLRIFERFGSYFTAMEPLRDVAVYASGWPNRDSVVLHDLARMRRPGMLLATEDVLAGKLDGYKVLFLAGVGDGEPTKVLEAFRAFEAGGGVILKDQYCAAALPGRDIGFRYDNEHVHNGWGLAYPNGEWEFAHLWTNFKSKREEHLIKAFADTPTIPITTPDSDVIISPLAGKESICAFVINQTLVPMSIEGKWRQHAVLPRIGDLFVEDGWHVRNLLAGEAVVPEATPQGRRVAADFTRSEGAVYLLTRREPKTMGMQTQRTAPHTLRLTAWLADAEDKPLADPMPFEVTLSGPDGTTLFRKFASLAPDLPLDIPVSVLSGETRLELTVRDLVIGCSASPPIAPAPESAVTAHVDADLIGGAGAISAFMAKRHGVVTVLLDEGQEAFRPAAEQLAAALRKSGRDARIVAWDAADARPLPLRWKPTDDDLQLIESLRDGGAFVGRVDMGAFTGKDPRKILFDDPRCGYPEYGPRLRFDGDIVLFGAPDNHIALAELQPYLRRLPSENYPAPGGFFVHHLWSPFRAAYNGLYLGCHDPAGAAAAVTYLAQLAEGRAEQRTAAAPGSAMVVVTWGRTPSQLENMINGKIGTRILDLIFSPGGNRLFVTTDSYGESFFALSPDGEIQEQRALHNRSGNNLWWRTGGRMKPVDDTSVRVKMWDSDYLYCLDRGFVSYASAPPHGVRGRMPIGATALLEATEHERIYMGGSWKLRALDAQGRLLWAYDDSGRQTAASQVLHPRSLFPRAVSADGKVLLVGGFGTTEDFFGNARPVNTAMLGLDGATGRLLWQRDGVLLNEGKAIPLGDRFLVADDSGAVYTIHADNGEEATRMRPVGGTDWMLPVPGREEVLIVENNRFDRQGLTAQVYIRPLGDGDDRDFAVEGRISDLAIAPDGQSITFTTDRGFTMRFDVNGRLLWRAQTPSGGLVRLAPDGKGVVVGAREGVLHFLSAQDGSRLRAVDLNPFNVTTGERFVKQQQFPSLPRHTVYSVPYEPPAPSYLTTLDAKKVPFGPNLLPEERIREVTRPAAPADGDPARPKYVGHLEQDTAFKFRVQAGKTYLVELLAAAAGPAKLTAQTRLVIQVTGARKTPNLPYVARLPLSRHLVRRRAAFRADESGDVTLTLRAVNPVQTGEGGNARLTYENGDPIEAGLNIAEVIVTAIGFQGPNLLFDGGLAAKTEPLGTLACEVKPWTGGNSTLRHQPWPCPQAALRCVDGVLADQETLWTKEATGSDVDWADGRVKFKRPQTLTSIAIYEDNTGPVPSGSGVQERTAPHYAVYVREAKTRQWRRVGHVVDNTQLVNIFECPPVPVDEIHYLWAGRRDAGRIDGFVRMAEIEAYADEVAVMLDSVLDGADDLLDAGW